MSEPFPSKPPDQAPAQDPYSNVGRSGFPMPSESIGAARPKRQYRNGLRSAVFVVLGLGVACLSIWSATRWLVILLYAGLAWYFFIRLIVRRLRVRMGRPRPPSHRG
jgi:hypothetical protein